MDISDMNTLYLSFLFLRKFKRKRLNHSKKKRLWTKRIYLQRQAKSVYYIFLEETKLQDRESYCRQATLIFFELFVINKPKA